MNSSAEEYTLTNDAMIEETGLIVAMDGDTLWIETTPRSACGHCNVGGSCGTSVLARWFGKRTNRVRVYNSLGLGIGQRAVIGVSELALLKAAFIAYLIPLLTMVSAAILTDVFDAGEGAVIAWSLGGLGLGLFYVHYLGVRQKATAYQARLMRVAYEPDRSANPDLPVFQAR